MPQPNIKSALEQTGKFKIQKEFTEGQNAYAFEAYHTHLNREVFLKLYDYSDSIAADVLREPRTVIDAMRGFRSDNVVELFDAEVLEIGTDKFLCLQMELVTGENLLSLMQKGEVGQQDAVRLTAGVLNGLAHLHSRRILHRDLKPANIVGAGGIAKITDFGSVAVLPEEQTAVSASKHSALYVPPEASLSHPGYTFASDLYQVGMVLYELVNGPLEYDLQHYLTPKYLNQLRRSGEVFDLSDPCERSLAADAVIQYLAQRQKLLEHGRSARPYFSAQLRKIVIKATKPDPSDRFCSAQEFCAKLTQVNVPNWKTVDQNTFRAAEWKGWDWEIVAAGELVLRKSRPHRDSYRRFAGKQFSNLRDALDFIEGQ